MKGRGREKKKERKKERERPLLLFLFVSAYGATRKFIASIVHCALCPSCPGLIFVLPASFNPLNFVLGDSLFLFNLKKSTGEIWPR